MTQFLCDSVMETDFCTPEMEKTFCEMYNSTEAGFDSMLETVLLSDSVHSVFNEIANIRPASSSSSDEDDKNLIMSWELNEKNLDTLPSSPLRHIKQESEDLFISDSESCGQTVSSSQSICGVSIIETPPVSPDVKPVKINSSPTPVDIVLIESNHPNVLPLQPVSSTSSRLVSVTPWRSQAKQSDMKKVPVAKKNMKLNCAPCDIDKNLSFKSYSSNGGCDTISLLLPKLESSPIMTSLSDTQIKAMKRQQRMIKNRESASLSRKKKKEYVTYLEQRLDDLSKENNELKKENQKLKDRLEQCEKVSGWHTTSKLFDKTKKITAVFVVMFMISFNVSSFKNFPSKTSDELPEDVIFKYSTGESHHGRSLLWADDGGSNNSSENLSSTDHKHRNSFSNEKCPLSINQTESLRLDSELRKWIDAYPVDNTTHMPPKLSNDTNKQIPWPIVSVRKENKRSLQKKVPVSQTFAKNRGNVMEMFDLNNNFFDVNEPLYQAMDRKQDTFYVVSFSGDHLLLPAVMQNQTLRPKMSLVLPSVTANGSLPSSDIVTMMQIDCTVIDTKVLHVKQKDIPPHLKSASVKNIQKNNISYFKQGVRRKFNPSYSLPIAEKNYLVKNPV